MPDHVKHREEHQRSHGTQPFIGVLGEAAPGLGKPAIHAAFHQRRAVEQVGPTTRLPDAARQHDAVMHAVLEGGMPAAAEPGLATHQQKLAAACAQRRPTIASHEAHGQVSKQHEVDQRHHECLTHGAACLSRKGAHKVATAAPRETHGRRDRVRRDAHIGIREQQPRRVARLPHALAAPLLAVPAVRQRLRWHTHQSAVLQRQSFKDAGRVIGALIVVHQCAHRNAHARQCTLHACLDVAGLVTGRNADIHPLVDPHGNRRNAVAAQIQQRHPQRQRRTGQARPCQQRPHVAHARSPTRRATSIAPPRPVTRSHRS